MTPLKILSNSASNFAIRTPSRAKIFVWTIGLALGIALTIKDFIPLLSEYQYNNVAIQVDVVLLDEEYTAPQMVVNFPRVYVRKEQNDLVKLTRYLLERKNESDCGNGYEKSDEDVWIMCTKLVENSMDAWNDQKLIPNYTNLDTDEFYSLLSATLIKKITENRTFLTTLDDDHSNWNGPIFSALLDFFEWQTRHDYTFTIPRTNLDQEPWSRMEIEDEIVDQLFPLMTNLICKRMTYIESDYLSEFRDRVPINKNCTDVLKNSPDPVLLDLKGLWFRLDSIEKPSIKEYRLIVDNFHGEPAPVVLFADTGSLYVSDLDGPYFPYFFQTPDEKRALGKKVSVRYKVQMRAKGTRMNHMTCRHGTSVPGCFVQCTKLLIVRKCQCVPFSMRKGITYTMGSHFWPKNASGYPEKLPYCTPRNVTDCNITTLPDSVKSKCMETCKESCEYTSYSWQISYESFEPYMANTSIFILKMVPMFDTFAELVRTTKNTPEQFFSQCAGIANFYLGISGLSLFALISACIDWWKKYKRLRDSKNGDSALEDAQKLQPGRNEFGGNSQREFEMIKSESRNASLEKEEWFLHLKESLRSEMAKDMLATVRYMREKREKPDSWIVELKTLMIDEVREEIQKKGNKKILGIFF